MQQHTIRFWTHLDVMWWAHFVIKVWHSLDLWCFQDNWELWKKTRLNHDVSNLQVGALESGLSSQLGILSWMTVQNIFPVGTHLSLRFPSSEFPVVLNVAEVMLDWQHGQCWIFILLKKWDFWNSHPLPWWQLCLAISQPASSGMLFQQSWRSSHIFWVLFGWFSFTLRSDSIWLRSVDCGGQVI